MDVKTVNLVKTKLLMGRIFKKKDATFCDGLKKSKAL